MAESGLDPIGESANGPSVARGPRLDPIGEPLNFQRLAAFMATRKGCDPLTFLV
jgi:hypothetical protein